jgi:hypothetical protein
MKQRIDSIVQRASIGIKPAIIRRKTMLEYYDRIYKAIVDGGYPEFAAHEWAILKLSKLFGALRVARSFS